MTELFQEPGEGDGGEVVGLGPIAKKVIQRFIYLKLYLLSSGAPKVRAENPRLAQTALRSGSLAGVESAAHFLAMSPLSAAAAQSSNSN